jgi:hypothetical protein
LFSKIAAITDGLSPDESRETISTGVDLGLISPVSLCHTMENHPFASCRPRRQVPLKL